MKKYVRYAIVNLLLLTLFFAIMEFGQRVRYSIKYRNKNYLLFGTKKYKKGLMETPAFKVSVVRCEGYIRLKPGDYRLEEGSLHVNSNGLRGREFERAKPEGVHRIIALGSSATFGVSNSDDTTYPAALEGLLKADAKEGLRYEVINAGIPATTSREMANFLKRELLSYSPDMVLLYNGCNDWGLGDRVKGFIEPIGSIGPVKRFFMTKSLLCLSLMEKYQLRKTGGIEGIYMDVKKIARETLEDKTQWRDYEDNLIEIARLLKANEVPLVLIPEVVNLVKYKSAQDSWKSYDLWHVHVEMTREINKRVADIFNAGYLDLGPDFEKTDKEVLFMGASHLRDAGNAKLAEFIFHRIKR